MQRSLRSVLLGSQVRLPMSGHLVYAMLVECATGVAGGMCCILGALHAQAQTFWRRGARGPGSPSGHRARLRGWTPMHRC